MVPSESHLRALAEASNSSAPASGPTSSGAAAQPHSPDQPPDDRPRHARSAARQQVPAREAGSGALTTAPKHPPGAKHLNHLLQAALRNSHAQSSGGSPGEAAAQPPDSAGELLRLHRAGGSEAWRSEACSLQTWQRHWARGQAGLANHGVFQDPGVGAIPACAGVSRYAWAWRVSRHKGLMLNVGCGHAGQQLRSPASTQSSSPAAAPPMPAQAAACSLAQQPRAGRRGQPQGALTPQPPPLSAHPAQGAPRDSPQQPKLRMQEQTGQAQGSHSQHPDWAPQATGSSPARPARSRRRDHSAPKAPPPQHPASEARQEARLLPAYVPPLREAPPEAAAARPRAAVRVRQGHQQYQPPPALTQSRQVLPSVAR